ncbi:hypothetical protein B0H34DRAFT_327839 [Crassisporium funariophilum]|nr:hypothetical protein B0H34DRAFT_327839 [Crassisporium funariophilum]
MRAAMLCIWILGPILTITLRLEAPYRTFRDFRAWLQWMGPSLIEIFQPTSHNLALSRARALFVWRGRNVEMGKAGGTMTGAIRVT